MNVSIYHNPRCSKSRQTLALLQENGHEITIIDYLKTPPSITDLQSVIQKLGISARELMRKNEPEYKVQQLDNEALSDEQLLQAMLQYPKLIQRPIVLANEKAAIGRPPEAILNILK